MSNDSPTINAPTAADIDEMVDILRRLAPPDRTHGWHYQEDCEYDADEWKSRQAEEQLADGGDPYPRRADYPDDSVWMPLQKAWRERVDARAATLPEPTDEQLCENGCLYPRARAVLARLESGDSGDDA